MSTPTGVNLLRNEPPPLDPLENSIGRRRSILYRGEIGSSGWIADLRRDAVRHAALWGQGATSMRGYAKSHMASANRRRLDVLVWFGRVNQTTKQESIMPYPRRLRF